MEFKITKEFIIEAHGEACSVWKKRIESEFPEAFPKLKIGKWYKSDIGGLWCISGESTESKQYSFGLNRFGQWSNESIRNSRDLTPATEEEVSGALIAEAMKRGFGNAGVKFIDLETGEKAETFGSYMYLSEKGTLKHLGATFFKDGIWATILPEEKTVITREKALKILAKKLKVSPENIEIK